MLADTKRSNTAPPGPESVEQRRGQRRAELDRGNCTNHQSARWRTGLANPDQVPRCRTPTAPIVVASDRAAAPARNQRIGDPAGRPLRRHGCTRAYVSGLIQVPMTNFTTTETGRDAGGVVQEACADDVRAQETFSRWPAGQWVRARRQRRWGVHRRSCGSNSSSSGSSGSSSSAASSGSRHNPHRQPHSGELRRSGDRELRVDAGVPRVAVLRRGHLRAGGSTDRHCRR